MLIYVVTSSINPLTNLKSLYGTNDHEIKILVIDEGDEKIRKANNKILSNISHEYYGPRERKKWFKERFGQAFKKYLDLIPEKCHAETSFGFLKAYEDRAEIVLEVDDDVHFSENFLQEHLNNLFSDKGVTVRAHGNWYNTIENLHLNLNHRIFPRGHPYDPQCRTENYVWIEKGGNSVLNMGLWSGHPDLDALTILYYGGLNGKCRIESKDYEREKIVLDKRTYFAICSMNTSFLSKIIPAYYQLYMNFMGIDRFDDIWSGVFLKRITDQTGDRICLGKPLVLHLKRSRNIFKDLRKEINGLDMNEHLWKISEEAELSAKTYADCYLELAEHLKKSLRKWFKDPTSIKFWNTQIEKMRRWVEVTDKIS